MISGELIFRARAFGAEFNAVYDLYRGYRDGCRGVCTDATVDAVKRKLLPPYMILIDWLVETVDYSDVPELLTELRHIVGDSVFDEALTFDNTLTITRDIALNSEDDIEARAVCDLINILCFTSSWARPETRNIDIYVESLKKSGRRALDILHSVGAVIKPLPHGALTVQMPGNVDPAETEQDDTPTLDTEGAIKALATYISGMSAADFGYVIHHHCLPIGACRANWIGARVDAWRFQKVLSWGVKAFNSVFEMQPSPALRPNDSDKKGIDDRPGVCAVLHTFGIIE